MTGKGRAASLEAELRSMRARLKEPKPASKEPVTPSLLERLQEEGQRCDRYNHYFALLTLASPTVGAKDILKKIKGSLRASDVVGIVDAEGRYHRLLRVSGAVETKSYGAVARDNERAVMILPEADRKGAENAVRRLSGVLTAKEQVTFGIAVYPDDSTNVEELLAGAGG